MRANKRLSLVGCKKAGLRSGTAYTANMKQIPVEAVVLSCINIPIELAGIINAENNISFLLTTYSAIGHFIFKEATECYRCALLSMCVSVLYSTCKKNVVNRWIIAPRKNVFYFRRCILCEECNECFW